MAMVGLKSEADAGTRGPATGPSRAGRLLRRISLSAVMPAEEVVLTRDADGIVVLTGGASRVADAIELLAAGRGRRLLISGVNRATNRSEISRLNPEFTRVVGCCVDFDRSLNTLGNAVETRRWTQARGFRSLIVVTSNYYMPSAATNTVQ